MRTTPPTPTGDETACGNEISCIQVTESSHPGRMLITADGDPDGRLEPTVEEWAAFIERLILNLSGDDFTCFTPGGLALHETYIRSAERTRVTEEIAQALIDTGHDPDRNLAWMYPKEAAEIARQHGRQT